MKRKGKCLCALFLLLLYQWASKRGDAAHAGPSSMPHCLRIRDPQHLTCSLCTITQQKAFHHTEMVQTYHTQLKFQKQGSLWRSSQANERIKQDKSWSICLGSKLAIIFILRLDKETIKPRQYILINKHNNIYLTDLEEIKLLMSKWALLERSWEKGNQLEYNNTYKFIQKFISKDSLFGSRYFWMQHSTKYADFGIFFNKSIWTERMKVLYLTVDVGRILHMNADTQILKLFTIV